LLPIRIRTENGNEGRDDNFAEALRLEVPGMLYKARECYEKHCSKSHIRIDLKAYAENFDDFHYKFQTILGQYLRCKGERVLHDSIHLQLIELMDLETLPPHDRKGKMSYFWRLLQSKFNTGMITEIEAGQEKRYIVGIAKISDIELQHAHNIIKKEDSL
jgi:hypothetical protein